MGVGYRTTLNDHFRTLRDSLVTYVIASEAWQSLTKAQPHYREFRAGDVRHSQADICKSQRLFGYAPTHRLKEGIAHAVPWYVETWSYPKRRP